MSLSHLKKAGDANFIDSKVTKANEIISAWNGTEASNFSIIGVPLSKTSISHSGASFAPASIRKMLSSYSTYHIEDQIDLKDFNVTDFGDITMHVTDFEESRNRIRSTISELLGQYKETMPIILGGDHGISFPSISAFAKERGTVGVIQFDAHHDLRNTEDGGRSNGTPFRSLIDEGILKGEHLVQIGIRNFSNSAPYTEFGVNNGVTIYSMRDVRELGISKIIKESINHLVDKVDAIYISLDMDVLDQAFAPGCPAIGPGGMDSQTLLDGICYLASHPKVTGMDIVELDPTIDFRDMTSRIAAHVILNFLVEKVKLLNK
ncbi:MULTISPECIES: formimidoylglutamase [Bacillaceae]|uniref:formimidoylglutamase n=1 Tax=Bacillaceae TaxID=186817 RepID=UPI0006F60CA7|nr:formimidoylglutamase [Bacillus sp. FJAT-25509]KQL32971.1 formimidoylglutamase [Bacillus sp. FJAT-25509]